MKALHQMCRFRNRHPAFNGQVGIVLQLWPTLHRRTAAEDQGNSIVTPLQNQMRAGSLGGTQTCSSAAGAGGMTSCSSTAGQRQKRTTPATRDGAQRAALTMSHHPRHHKRPDSLQSPITDRHQGGGPGGGAPAARDVAQRPAPCDAVCRSLHLCLLSGCERDRRCRPGAHHEVTRPIAIADPSYRYSVETFACDDVISATGHAGCRRDTPSFSEHAPRQCSLLCATCSCVLWTLHARLVNAPAVTG